MNAHPAIALHLAAVSLLPVRALTAQQAPGDAPPAAVPPASPAPLAGPKVGRETRGETAPAATADAPAAAARRPSLVILDFAGHVRRYDEPVEQAAAALLPLDDATRAKVQAIIDRRLATIDALITANLDLLVEAASAGGAGAAERFDLFVRGWEALRPLRDLGPLRRSIRDALPPDAAAEYDRLLGEYWTAVVAEVRAHGADDQKRQPRWQIVVGEQFQALGREVAASFQRMLRSGDLVSAYLLRGMDLTDQQQASIREHVARFVERHGENATKAQQAWLVLAVLAELTPEQRIELVRRLRRL